MKQSMIEGTILAIAGVLILLLSLELPTAQTGLFGTDFASRWEGSCNGWTKWITFWHAIGNLQFWWAYSVIAIVLLRSHPTIANIPESKVTILLTGAFFIGCGITQLFNTYTNFVPMYRLDAVLKNIVGLISVVGAYYIAYSLDRAFKIVREKRERAEKIHNHLRK